MTEIALLLPNIRSTYNVGSIFRSAEIFGVKEIIISGYTPYPQLPNDSRIPHLARKIDNQISKTALGTEKVVPFCYFPDTKDALIYAQKNYGLVALEQSDKALSLNNYKPAGKLAFVVGEEVDGLPKDILSACEMIVEIPQIGKKESLNVASAVAILLYDISIGKMK
jgi:23S rRNA (guanosine2251-2'-O)-methyltransferase